MDVLSCQADCMQEAGGGNKRISHKKAQKTQKEIFESFVLLCGYFSAGPSEAPPPVRILPLDIFPFMNIPPFLPSLSGRKTTVILSPVFSVVLVQPRRFRKFGLIPSKP